jgi:outer membrane receptor protein involved in Fe transport
MAGYARPYWLGGRDVNVPDVAGAIGLKNSSKLGGAPYFNNGYSMNGLASGGAYMDSTDNLYQAGGDLTHIRGRHSFKLGFQAIERRMYFITHTNDKGTFVFSPVSTAACPDGNAPCAAARAASGLDAGGNAFASYLLGTPTSITFALNAAPFNGQRRYYGTYLQDSWRVNGRLTLNYGLRYERWAPWLLPRHTVATFNRRDGTLEYVLQNPLDYLDVSKGSGRTAKLNPNLPEAGYSQGAKNFGPRVGLAYSITSKTVFRAGYGVYYDGNTITSRMSTIMSSVGPFRLQYNGVASTNEQTPSLQVNGNFPFPNPTAIPAPNANPLAGVYCRLQRS